MGYESKIIVAVRYEMANSIWFNQLATIDLSRCDGNFRDIFTTEVESDIYGDGYEPNDSENTFVMTEDRYGDICKYTDVQTVIDYLEKAMTRGHYRRYAVALATLKAFAMENWEGKIVVIHYGY